MAVAFGTSSTLVVNGGTTGAIPKPTGTALGDHLVIVQGCDASDNNTNGVPSGWAQVGTTFGGAADQYLYAWWKIATSVEVAASTFTVTANTGSARAYACIRSTGAASTAPQIAFTSQAASSATHVAPSLITTADGCMIVTGFTVAVSGGDTHTPPTGMTERVDFISGAFTALAVNTSTANQTTAGATGTYSSTASAASIYSSFTMAIAPAVTAQVIPDINMAWR